MACIASSLAGKKGSAWLLVGSRDGRRDSGAVLALRVCCKNGSHSRAPDDASPPPLSTLPTVPDHNPHLFT